MSRSYSDRAGERPSYRVGDDTDSIAKEQRRLEMLGELRDRRSARILDGVGITNGWHCLDVGSGGGALAKWMAERVGAAGSVLSTDIDVRFQSGGAENLEVRQHDIVHDPLPSEAFDLIHARAVLQTIEQREAVLDKMVTALRPGGWLVLSDPEWTAFERQELPPQFRKLYETMMDVAARMNGYDRYWPLRLLPAFRSRGLVDIECSGEVSTMHGGTDSAEWLILAYDRAAPGLIDAGLLDRETADAGLEEARRPDFLVLGPTTVTCRGRKPIGTSSESASESDDAT